MRIAILRLLTSKIHIGSILCTFFISLSFSSAFSADKVKIGIISALQKEVGRSCKNAAIMAADEINAKGGILGRQIKLAFADEEETPEKGITAVKKLAVQDEVQALIGGYTSGVTLAQMDYFPRYKLIYLGIGSASPAITERIKTNYDKYKYTFRISPLNSRWLAYDMGLFVVNFFGKKHGVKKVAILAEKAKWSETLAPFLAGFFKKNGLEVVLLEFFEVRTNDFSPIFSKVKKSGAGLLVELLSHAQDVFIKQYHDQQVPIPIAGISIKSQASDFYERTGGRCLGEIIMLSALRAPLTPRLIPFWDDYVKRWNKDPIFTAFGTYDAMYIYKEAVERAGSFDPEKVIPALEKTDWPSLVGRAVLDEKHDLKYGVDFATPYWAQWQEGGKRVLVWPEEKATGKVIFPDWVKLPK